jgi:hypothetical protein
MGMAIELAKWWHFILLDALLKFYHRPSLSFS